MMKTDDEYQKHLTKLYQQKREREAKADIREHILGKYASYLGMTVCMCGIFLILLVTILASRYLISLIMT